MTMPTSPCANTPVSPHSGIAAWRVLFRMLAGFIALFCFAFWAAAGWNLGWTKTQIAVKQIDAITGIEFITYKKHFIPFMFRFDTLGRNAIVYFIEQPTLADQLSDAQAAFA